jgi:hypothetical protein
MTNRQTTLARIALTQGSVRRRDVYLTAHDIHKRQTSMPPPGFEPAIAASKQPRTYALDCAATGTGDRDVRVAYC